MSVRSGQTQWHVQGDEVSSCNCDWGCPCQFNADPTDGGCEGVAGFRIRKGHFGAVPLDGVRFAQILVWPGRIDRGGGTMQLILDPESTAEQREAITVLNSGQEGGGYFEIFAATCSTICDPIVAPITLETDRERRTGKLIVRGIIENQIGPIRNPVTAEEHRARIVLPGGFEFTEAEMADSLQLSVTSTPPLRFEYAHTYGQLNAFDWSNARG
jgi:hypothetical protein